MSDIAVWVPGVPVADLGDGAPRLVRAGAKRIALFRVGDDVRAVDNRCPHEGYALTQGSVSADGVLTCVWHNWKFRLSDGACVLGGEAVRSYPVRVRDGLVEIDVRDPDPEALAPTLLASLAHAMEKTDVGRIGRDATRLLDLGTPVADVMREALRFAATRAEYGWDHAMATVADALDLAPYAAGRHRVLPAVTAMSVVATEHTRRPPRPVADPLEGADLPAAGELVAALRSLVEAEQADAAEAMVRGAVRAGYPRPVVEQALAVIVSDHFLSFGHEAIFAHKSLQLVDALGWDDAETVLGAHVYGTCHGTREDLLPYLARFEAARRELHGTPVDAPLDPGSLRALIPSAPAAELAVAVHRALDGGRRVEPVLDAIALAAADRLLAFDAGHDADRESSVGWLDITHTLTFANAVRALWRRTRSPELLRSVSHAAWFVSRAARYDDRAAPASRAAAAAPGAPASPGAAAAPATPDELDAVIDRAVARRDPDAGVAAASAWLRGGGDPGALEAAMARAALADGAAVPIHIAHCIKTTRAGIAERRAHGAAGGTQAWPLLLGPLRYLAAPKVERRTLRAVADANKFVR